MRRIRFGCDFIRRVRTLQGDARGEISGGSHDYLRNRKEKIKSISEDFHGYLTRQERRKKVAEGSRMDTLITLKMYVTRVGKSSAKITDAEDRAWA